jgi:hypothetical protein
MRVYGPAPVRKYRNRVAGHTHGAEIVTTYQLLDATGHGIVRANPA